MENKILDINNMKKDLKNNREDTIYALKKGIISDIPIIGSSTAAELFNLIFESPISKRRDSWLIKVTESLLELEERIDSFKIEDLSENESFLTTLMHASQLAIINNQEDKLKALKNAVLNSALPNAPEEDMQIIFLNFIDSFTVVHIKILNFFYKTKSIKWIEKIAHDIPNTERFAQYAFRDDVSVKVITFEFGKVMEYVFEDYIKNNMLYQFALNDLNSLGLIFESQEYSVIPIDGHNDPQVQPLGKQFMDFIKNPE